MDDDPDPQRRPPCCCSLSFILKDYCVGADANRGFWEIQRRKELKMLLVWRARLLLTLATLTNQVTEINSALKLTPHSAAVAEVGAKGSCGEEEAEGRQVLIHSLWSLITVNVETGQSCWCVFHLSITD
uniref:Uncharacterized protein n=1 Tax=Knipowitschia caucasica TaxID=637954 RepID=A0AAV2LSB8_KNICA